MPCETTQSLARAWALLVDLILQIRTHAARPVRLTRGRRNHLHALLRRAEALARRWLVVNARTRRLPPRRTARSARAPARTPLPPPAAGASVPRLSLLEPQPLIPAGDTLLSAPDPTFTVYAPGDPLPDFLTRTTAPEDLSPVSGAAAALRTRALLDLMRRPDHHTARMVRWLRRAAHHARTACVRVHPLRLGRPPGARRRRRECPIQAALWWLDRLARERLAPRASP